MIKHDRLLNGRERFFNGILQYVNGKFITLCHFNDQNSIYAQNCMNMSGLNYWEFFKLLEI